MFKLHLIGTLSGGRKTEDEREDRTWGWGVGVRTLRRKLNVVLTSCFAAWFICAQCGDRDWEIAAACFHATGDSYFEVRASNVEAGL